VTASPTDLHFKHALCPCRQFVRCVRCIKILSPSEVQKMSEEGMQLLNSAAMQGTNGPMSEGGYAWHQLNCNAACDYTSL